MAISSIKKRRKKLFGDVKFCTLTPQRLFIPHNLYRNPQETAKSITFETGSAYTQNRRSSHPAHMVNFIWPFWSGKKEGSKEIIGTSWDAKFQKPKEQVLHCPVVHSNSPCWLVSLYFLFQLYLWKSLEIPKPCTKCHSISKIISLKET